MNIVTKDSFEVIQTYLLQFGGGSVYLSKEYWDEGIVFMRINHPEKRNAISGKMMVDFRKCIEELEAWEEGKAVVLCGQEHNFCSGGDLDFARASGTPQKGFYMNYWMQDVLKRFRKLPMISVSLVHGPALGGGSELSVYSDYVVVADNVKLGFVHGKMGITTAWGGTTRLVQMLGARTAMEMICSSKIYNAEECLSLGLATKIVSTENRIEETLTFLRQLTTSHHSIVQSVTRVIRNSAERNFEEALEFEGEQFFEKWGSDLNRAALDKHMKHVDSKM